MIVFVDYEHADRYAQDGTDWLLAARARITYRLEDLAGVHCMLVRYDRLTPELLEQLDARAIFISGQGTDPRRYRDEDTAALAKVVRDAELPMFGFCGGWQFMATALGADLVQVEAPDSEIDTEIVVEWPSGGHGEFGYHPVDLADGAVDHPLLEGLGETPAFRHAHGLHIPEAPAGYDVLASTPVTPLQLVADEQRRQVGTQFHPEYWTDEHPDGQTLIANFLHWAEVT